MLVTPSRSVAMKFIEASQSFGLGVQPDAEVDVERDCRHRYTIDSPASVRDLGFEFTPMEMIISDTIRSFLEKGNLVEQK